MAPGVPMVTVRGRIDGGPPDGGRVSYIAAAPVGLNSSYSGSGLPFANREQAFYATPNRGTFGVAPDGSFEVGLVPPNSFYDGLGTVKVPPTLFISYTSGGRPVRSSVVVGGGLPFRALTYPATRSSATFYAPEAPFVRSQEEILRASAYPETDAEPADFWGGKPAR